MRQATTKHISLTLQEDQISNSNMSSSKASSSTRPRTFESPSRITTQTPKCRQKCRSVFDFSRLSLLDVEISVVSECAIIWDFEKRQARYIGLLLSVGSHVRSPFTRIMDPTRQNRSTESCEMDWLSCIYSCFRAYTL